MSFNSSDWKGVAAMVGKFAPMLGTVIGGPVGAALGIGTSLLSNVLGVEETPDAIMAAIKEDPQAFAKIKQAELDNESELNRLSYATLQIEMQTNAGIIESLNKADATGHSTRPRIALELARAFLVGYGLVGVGLCYLLFTDGLEGAEVYGTIGTYLGLPLTVIKMYFGDLRKEHAQGKGQQVDFGMFGNLLGGGKK